MSIEIESLNDSETISVDDQVEHDFEELAIANRDTAWHLIFQYRSDEDKTGQDMVFRTFRHLVECDRSDKEFMEMYIDMCNLYYPTTTDDFKIQRLRIVGVMLGHYLVIAELLAKRYIDVYLSESIMKICYKILYSFNYRPGYYALQRKYLNELITELLGLDHPYVMSDTVWESLSKYGPYGALTHIYEVIKILGLPN